MKKFVLTALGIALAACSAGAVAKDWKTIRVGVDPSYPPFESKAPDGKLIGFDIDLGNALCAKIQAKCVWVEQDFDGMIPALKARKFDAIISSLSMTDQRREQINFSDTLFNAPIRLIARTGSSLGPTPELLKGKRVGVQQGTTAETYAKAYWQNSGINVVPYQNQDQVYADLLTGRLDATLQDEVQASIGFLKSPRSKGYSFAGAEINDKKTIGEGTGIGLRREDTDLKLRFNQALSQLHSDGEFEALEKKYFDFEIYHR